MGKKRGRKLGQKNKPARCKWCGTLTMSVAFHRSTFEAQKYRCLNPECPAIGQVPWVIPQMVRPSPRDVAMMFERDEGNPGLENGVRAMEDQWSE